MKGILEFDLPEERVEFAWATNAWSLVLCLNEVDQKLRNHLKHGSSESAEDVMTECRRMIGETLDLE